MNLERLKTPIPVREQKWPKGTTPLLHTVNLTYNHENYIAECIEGVLNQRTTFPIQILIHDDHSLDKTVEIIKFYQLQFPYLIKAYFQKENTYNRPDRKEKRKTFNNWRIGKYEAICEGDDYWTDVFKLEKQVQFLEFNIDYGLVLTDFDRLNQRNNRITKSVFNSKSSKYPLYLNKEDFLINAGYLAPLTWVYRTSIAIKKVETKIYYKTDYSFSFMLEFLDVSKIGYIDESTATYRVLEESASHSNSLNKRLERTKGIFYTQMHYADRFSLDQVYKEKINIAFAKNALLLSILCEDKELLSKVIKTLQESKPHSFRTNFLVFMSKFKLPTYLMKKISIYVKNGNPWKFFNQRI